MKKPLALAGLVGLATLLVVLFVIGTPGSFSGWIEPQPIASTGMFNLPRDVFLRGVTPSVLIVTAGYLFGTSYIGMCLLGLFPGAVIQGTCATSFVAGFIPGYLIVVACNRMVTLIVTHGWAPLVTLGTTVTIAGTLFLRRGGPRERPHPMHVGLIASLTILLGILSLSVSNSFVTGDATLSFLDLERKLLVGPGAGAIRFPIFGQHYDEVMYLHPLLFIFGRDMMDNLIFFYWVVYAWFKVALVVALWRVLRVQAGAYVAVAITVILFVGRHTPTRHHQLLFDSGNPLLDVLHPTRILMAILPMLLVWPMSRLNHAPTGRARAGLIILGLGISSLPANAPVTAIISAGLAALVAVLRRAEPTPVTTLSVQLLLPPVVLCSLCGAYVLRLDSGALGVGAATFTLIIGLAAWVSTPGATGIGLSAAGPLAALTGWTAVGAAMGWVFFGNMLAGKFEFYEMFDVDFLHRDQPIAISFGVNPHLGYDQGPAVFHHMLGPFDFLQAYGLPFILAFSSMVSSVLLMHVPKRGERPHVMLTTLIAILALMCGSLLIYDFFNGQGATPPTIWVKSRLVEPWFYAVIAWSLVVLADLLEPKISKARFATLSGLALAGFVLVDPMASLPLRLVYAVRYLVE